MKYHTICHILVLGIILPLLVMLTTTPANAAGIIALSLEEGEIGDRFDIEGRGFEDYGRYRIYFSSDRANEGDSIDAKVTVYNSPATILADADGDFITEFTVPAELTDGKYSEYVHGGDYYVYMTHYKSTSILAIAEFTVIGGEIEINPEVGQVGSEVDVSGKRFGISQQITIEYDGDVVDIASGDKETDDEGKFIGTIIIPESTVGAHIITVFDEFGNEPEAEFSVKPKITVDPPSGAVDEIITVIGTGFKDRGNVTITFDGSRISTTPIFIRAKGNGSFTASFLVPHDAVSGSSKIRASDGSLNWAETELTVPAGVSLRPTTSQASPGYVNMELTIRGTGFIAGDKVTITYDDTIVETATADSSGNFSVTFTTPPSVAGNHTITVTDGTNTITSTFTMESEAPLIPMLLLPKVATTVETEAYFDWEDVTDPSGITYILQIGADIDFTTIVLEEKELTQSEYTLTEEEALGSTETDAPYYWRVRAIDGAFNEGKWTAPVLFYVGLSPGIMPGWTLYIWIGLGALLLGVLGFWVLRRIKK